MAAALATHVADVADGEQLELAADALVRHLLIDVMDDVKARAQSHPSDHCQNTSSYFKSLSLAKFLDISDTLRRLGLNRLELIDEHNADIR